MTSTATRGLTALIAASLAVAGLAACSSGSGGSGATSSTITVGIGVPLSGFSVANGEDAKPAAEAWGKWINDKGGINGHRVQVEIADTKSQAAAGLVAIKDLVGKQHADAVMILDATAEQASISYLQQNKIPLLGIGYNQQIYGKLPYVYQSATSVQGQIKGLPIAGRASGLTKFGAVVCQETAACAQTGPELEGAATAAGMQYTGLVTAAASQPDYTAQCLQLKQKGTDLIYLGLSAAASEKFIASCTQQGYTGWYGAHSNAERLVDLAKGPTGTKWLATLAVFPWWIDAPGPEEYRAAMQKYEPGVDYRSSASAGVWSSLQLLAQALASTSASEITPAVVNQAMGSVKGTSLDGLLPSTMTLDPTGVTPAVNCMWFTKYTVGDKDLSLVKTNATVGNAATGGLASACAD